MQFSSLINIEPSATLAMSALAKERRAQGNRVFDLSIGEPMVATDPRIIAAADQAMRDGKTHYTPSAGILELREAAARWMHTQYKTEYRAEDAIVTCGGKHALFMLCQALLQPGDEAIVVAPYWTSYSAMAALFGAHVQVVQTRPEAGWKLSPEMLDRACSRQTKIVFLNNVSNPTGVLYARDELKQLLEVAEKHDVVVISDEVYSGLVYDGNEFVSCGSFPQFRDRVVVVQSCSKHFAMTGWRVGFAFGPSSLLKILSTLQGQSTTGTSSISQWAAVAAFAHADDIFPQINKEMAARRDLLVDGLNAIGIMDVVKPSGGLYLFIPAKRVGGASTVDATAWCEKILKERNVAAVPGNAFGAPEYMRLSFGGTPEELRGAIRALAA